MLGLLNYAKNYASTIGKSLCWGRHCDPSENVMDNEYCAGFVERKTTMPQNQYIRSPKFSPSIWN